jgi:N-acetylglucosamine-6-phosphate deacetylase
MLFLHHASLLTPAGPVADGAVLTEGDRILAVGPSTDIAPPPGVQGMDTAGLTLAPGLIDLQINGGFGLDFTADPDSIWQVAARLPQHGVTAFLPTIISSPPEVAAQAQQVLAQGPPPGFAGALPLGLHLEGPFLNPAKRGAHNPAHLRLPDLRLVENWAPETGVRLVTLAPELPGALEVARALRKRGVVVSAGHSLATYEETVAGFEAGIAYGTHLFNAMPPLEHRAPGLAGALLADERPTFGLIADGIHVHPAVVALAWRAAGPRRLTLVTDAMAALGMPPGTYRLGDQQVRVGEASARLADGRLAGSVSSLDQAVRNLVAFTGCTPAEALATVTETPARLLGLSRERGRIAPGLRADFVLLDEGLQVKATVLGGELV